MAATVPAGTPFAAVRLVSVGTPTALGLSSTRGSCTTARGHTSTAPTGPGTATAPGVPLVAIAAATAAARARTPSSKTTSGGTPPLTATSHIASATPSGTGMPSRGGATACLAGPPPSVTVAPPAVRGGRPLAVAGSTTCGGRPSTTALVATTATVATERLAGVSPSLGTFAAPSSRASRPTLVSFWSTGNGIAPRGQRPWHCALPVAFFLWPPSRGLRQERGLI